MWSIFAAGILTFSVCVFSLEISRGCTYIGGGRGGLKRKWGELNFKQVAPIAHRIDRLLMCGGDFFPQGRLSSVCSRGFPAFTWCISPGLPVYFHVQQWVISQVFLPNFPGLQLRISLSLVVTLFAASILEPLKRLCCLVSPFKSPNPAGLYQV